MQACQVESGEGRPRSYACQERRFHQHSSSTSLLVVYILKMASYEPIGVPTHPMTRPTESELEEQYAPYDYASYQGEGEGDQHIHIQQNLVLPADQEWDPEALGQVRGVK